MSQTPFKAYSGNEPYIFVSYSHGDSDKVFKLLKYLYGKGYRIWYDEGIEVGDKWANTIAERLKGSSLLLACLTERMVASDNCEREIYYAVRNHIEILPIFMGNVFQLPAGLEMQIEVKQFIVGQRFKEPEQFFNEVDLFIQKTGKRVRVDCSGDYYKDNPDASYIIPSATVAATASASPKRDLNDSYSMHKHSDMVRRVEGRFDNGVLLEGTVSFIKTTAYGEDSVVFEGRFDGSPKVASFKSGKMTISNSKDASMNFELVSDNWEFSEIKGSELSTKSRYRELRNVTCNKGGKSYNGQVSYYFKQSGLDVSYGSKLFGGKSSDDVMHFIGKGGLLSKGMDLPVPFGELFGYSLKSGTKIVFSYGKDYEVFQR